MTTKTIKAGDSNAYKAWFQSDLLSRHIHYHFTFGADPSAYKSKKMAMVSMLFSVPSLNSPNLRPTKRYSGMDFATSNQEAVSVGVKITQGEGNLPKLVLTSDHGSEAEIYLFGGCITSWKVPSGRDLLFVRPDAVFNKKKPISGGIPHCFPQFGPGPMQQVILNTKSISTELIVTNTDKKPFSFSSALHSYFRASITGVSVKGLKGCKTLNKDPDPKNPIEGREERDVITFPGFVDCIYLDAPDEVHLDNGLGDVISIRNTNWSDAVLWNPHLQMEACYKDFVCVENAKIGTVQLEPEQLWIAKQHLSIG
ncbi:putative glucose-6-phosphate 1-epimerase isoform X2 [Durio zibethinus]|uniref:Glucose-6-phosphate 1-epimerase isoform X2 n=1 Tax=Durio zibethinus TaxID=66656 RepID=A0A6P5YGL5_DURZI|nr:putative glucose-6-phosphate 1-epimerase isoform X2 [Durio zibethinus]